MDAVIWRRKFGAGFKTCTYQTSAVEIRTQGRLPDWLSGNLLRTAPALFEVGDRAVNHWFDGYALLYRFGIDRGRVTFASRMLESRSYRAARDRGTIEFAEFATDPCRTQFARVSALMRGDLTDNGNVSVNAIGDSVVALTETPLPIRFDPETLETLGVYRYAEHLQGQVSIAHPHFDFSAGLQYSFLINFGRQCRYRLFSVDLATGRQRVVAHMPVECPAYVHSIGMSERFLVLVESPLVVNPYRLFFSGEPFIRNYKWKPRRCLRFHIFSKACGSRIRLAEADPVMSFHHVNAFERDGELVVDLIGHRDSGLIDRLYLDRLRGEEPTHAVGSLIRYRIPLSGPRGTEQQVLSETQLELPRINYRHRVGQSYRAVWGVGCRIPENFYDSIVRIDPETGETLTWYEPGCYPGEPVFVAAPQAVREDEGVLLSVVFDGSRERSFLLVLDAATLQEVARAEAPHIIPFGFHGNYFPQASGSGVNLDAIHP